MENNSQQNKRRPRVCKEKVDSKTFQPDTSVWAVINAIKRKYDQDIFSDDVFSKYKNDRERIRDNTHKYANMSIAEAFADVYNLDLKPETYEMSDIVPVDLKLGQLVDVKISNIGKDGVLFDSGSYKTNFTTRNNLYRYSKFRNFLPVGEIQARVVEVKNDTTMIDLFGLMVESFVVPLAKEPWRQYKLKDYKPITVKNLKLVRGGFIGEAVIPNISDWVGEDYTIEAFIPGSQIVLNTTDDFEQFIGQTVEAFITAYTQKPRGNGMSLICSVKNLIKHRGNLRLKDIYDLWCDDGEEWKQFQDNRYEGIVTGVINSSQKCGVFVEVPELEITGMVNVPADELTMYHPGDRQMVGLVDFDEKMVYNDTFGQMQHGAAFEIEDGALKEVNVKPVLKFA